MTGSHKAPFWVSSSKEQGEEDEEGEEDEDSEEDGEEVTEENLGSPTFLGEFLKSEG